MAELNEQIVQKYAEIFAQTLKRQGILSANVSNAKMEQSKSNNAFTEFNKKSRIEQERILKKNNKLLMDYLEIQKNLNKDSDDYQNNLSKQRDIEKQLQKDSIILGKSYVSAIEAFKNNKISEKDVKDFSQSSDIKKLYKNFDEKIEYAGDQMSDSIIRSSEAIYTKTHRAIDKLFSAINVKAMLGGSFIQFGSEFRAGLKYGNDMTRNFWDAHINAFKMGISPADMLELESRNKQLINAMGGADNFESQMGAVSSKMFKYYGDLGESTRSTTQALNALAMGGITPNIDMIMSQSGALSNMTKMMEKTRDLTGSTFAEQNAAMEEYIKHDITKTKLVARSNSADRFALIQRTIANKNLLASLGLTAEQADRVAESFDGLAGMDPKERLKESYKAQAIMGSLGIEGAAELGKVIRAGGIDAANLSEEERRLAINASKKFQQMRAKAVTGEINSSSLLFGELQKILGPMNNIFSVMNDVALAEERGLKIKEMEEKGETKSLDYWKEVIAENLNKLLPVLDMITTGATTNSLLMAILGGVGSIAFMMKTSARLKIGTNKNKNRTIDPGIDYDKNTKKRGRAGRVLDKGKSVLGGLKDKSGKLLGATGKGISKIGGLIGTAAGTTISAGKAAGGMIGNIGGKALSEGKSVLGGLKDKSGKLLGAAGKGISKIGGLIGTAAGTTISAGKAAGGMIGNIGGKALSVGKGMLGKAALPLLALNTAIDGIQGWNNAGNVFNTDKISTGMKAATAFGSVLSGISFGLVDSAEMAKNAYNLFDDTKLNKKTSRIQEKTKNSEKTTKSSENESKLLELQQLIELQQQNSELIKMTNEILSNNFEKVNNHNIKQHRTFESIRQILESDSILTGTSEFKDSFSFI